MKRENPTLLVISVLSLAIIVGAGWFMSAEQEGPALSPYPGLVRNPEITKDNIARKEGLRPDLQAGKSAAAKGRRDYWAMRKEELPMGALAEAKKQADLLPALTMDKDGGLPEWTWLGPGNVGGRVRALVIDPVNPSLMLLGGVTGGIWRSTNGGNWWSPVNDFMANLSISCMAMTPDRQYIFAGTGEGFKRVIPGEGVFRSADLGLTWEQMPIPDTDDFKHITRLAPHPTIDGRLYLITWNGVLYRSDDDGVTWNDEFYLGAWGCDVKITNQTASGTPWIFIGARDNAFLSKDDGATFNTMAYGFSGSLPDSFGRAEVAFGTSAGNDPYLYASLEFNKGEIWRSTNGGANWTQRNAGSNYFGDNEQGWYDNALWVEPGNPNRLIVGGIDLHTSEDGGTNIIKKSDWRDYHTGTSAHADHHIIVPHPNYSAGNPILFFGNDGGVQRRDNIWSLGENTGWVNLANGLGITQFYTGSASTNGSVVIAGAQDNSFLRFNNGNSESWYQNTTGDGAYVAVKPTDASTIYASTQYMALRRSRNGGSSYTYLGGNIPDQSDSTYLFIPPFKIDKSNANALFAGGLSVWRSTNEGDSWSRIRTARSDSQMVSAIEQSPSVPSRIYLGYNKGRISRSIDSGSTWTDIQSPGDGMLDKFVTDIAVNPSNSNDVIVAMDTYTGTALWRSFNGGSSWTNMGAGGFLPLPDMSVNTVTFHPTNTSWIYVGTDFGVFATEDGGNNWSKVTSYPGSEGPANTKVSDLFWAGETLYAATHGRGMFSTWPRVSVYVDVANAGGGGQDGSQANPYQSINQSQLSAGHGTTITVEGGTYQEVNGLEIKKRGVLQTRNGAVIIK